MRPPIILLKRKRARRSKEKPVSVYQNANKRVVTESLDNITAKKSMRFSNEVNPSHQFSVRLDEEQGPSRVSSRLVDGSQTDKQSLPILKESLEIQKESDLNVDIDNPQFIKFQKKWYP